MHETTETPPPSNTPKITPADARSALGGLLGELLLTATPHSPSFARRLSAQLQRFVIALVPHRDGAAGAAAGGVAGRGGGEGVGLLEGAAEGSGAGLLAASAVVQGGCDFGG